MLTMDQAERALLMAFRDSVVQGVPASGANEPIKPEIRAALSALISVVRISGSNKAVATSDDLADLPNPQQFDRAEVMADPLGDVEGGNGVWSYQGIAWVWLSDSSIARLAGEAEAAGAVAAAAAESIGGSIVRTPQKPMAVLTDADGWAWGVVEGDGHLRRNMAREPAKPIESDAFARLETDPAGWAASVERIDGRPQPVNAFDGNLIHVLGTGQSKSLGIQATARTTSAFSSDVVKFVGGVRPFEASTSPATIYASLTPLTETYVADLVDTDHYGPAGETQMAGAGKMLLQLLESRFGVTLADLDAKVLMSACGKGSTPSMYLAEGNTPFTRGVEQMTYGRHRAQDAGGIYNCPLMIRDQGESDMTLATTEAEYRRLVLAERRAYEKHLSGKTGEWRPMVMSHPQISAFTLNDDQRQVSFAQVRMAEEDPWIVCSTPQYIFDYINAGSKMHMTADSQFAMGAYAMKAYLLSCFRDAAGRIVFDPARKFRPLSPLRGSARFQGRVAAIDFHNPNPGTALEFDSTLITPIGFKGFQIARPGVGLLTIEEPRISGNTLILPCTETLRSGDQILGGLADTDWQLGPVYGARTQLVSRSPIVFDQTGINRRLDDYCVHFLEILP